MGSEEPETEMWKLYNTKIQKGESMRVFPISNWTEKDIWQYIQRENIEIVPLYFAKERPVIYRDGNIIMVDDDRLKLRPGEKIEHKKSQIPYSWMLSADRWYRI